MSSVKVRYFPNQSADPCVKMASKKTLADFGFFKFLAMGGTKKPGEEQATSPSVKGFGEAREVLMKAPRLHQKSFPRSPKSDRQSL